MSVKTPPGTPVAWYRYDDVTLADTDKVASWNDKSGNGYHVTASGSLRPTYGSQTLNGHPVLTFDGANRLARATTPDISQPFTWLSVFRLGDDTDTGVSRVIAASTNDAGTNTILQGCRFESSGTGQFAGWGSGSLELENGGPDENWHYGTSIFNGGSSENIFDGATSSSGTGTSYNMNGLSIGDNVSGFTSSPWIGDIAEVTIYNSVLDFTSLTAWRRYLHYQYEITSAPPVGVVNKFIGYAVLFPQSAPTYRVSSVVILNT